ncbi:putative disease resistance protein RGA3 isoform X3 [Asparagus officinalis]|nr:putative disease resistance protein RGA3 isoform X3 [Asparagus officinalis]
MVVVGDVIASKIIEKLVEVGFDYAADQFFARRRRMNDELQRLKDALPRIRAVVNAAESGQGEITGDDLDEWLWQLKGAVYMASDVLDDLDYTDIQKRAEADAAGSGPRGSKVSGFISDSKRRVSKFSKRAFKSDPTLEKLRGAVKRLSEVAAGVEVFNRLVTERNQQQQQQQQQQEQLRETGPIVRERDVLGRDGDRKEVLQWLTRAPIANEDHEGISLFSIVGLGGVGKTTLAQVVYRDDTVQSSFGIKIWVCVSTGFDVKKITGDILEYAAQRRPDVGGLGPLQEALEALVSSKKFLLVLDDVWNDDDLSSWQTLFAPMRCGLEGSKIILTTRSKKVAEMATLALGGMANEPMKLNPLDKSDFLSLFNRYAFAGTNPHNHGKLQSIGEQIAGRLGGLPLAAKTIGALLRSNLDDSHWMDILQSRHISDHGPQRDGVMPALMLSYYYLPNHLRPCFAFLSTFPQDHRFFKDDLVLMWMALGFIQQSPQNPAQTPEDIGSRYVDELAKLSFLEQYGMLDVNPSTLRYEEVYIMHDLLHDLSSKVSHGECFTFVGDTSINQIPNTVRHLYFETGDLDLLKDMDKWKNLHTLILKFNGYNNEHAAAFRQMFESLESIRVLRITIKEMEVLPCEIGNLRHLRYLSVRHRSTRLPSSICKLYHLRVLDCGNIETSPVLVLNNLINLRHLLPCYLPYENVDGIGTLTSLQRLYFSAGAYKLSELKDLRELQELQISGLQNQRDGEEVSLVQLRDKKRLQVLRLEWDDDSDAAEEYEKVLDCLHPPDSLKELRITRYRGARSPYWMEKGLLKNLERVVLYQNTAWKHLPSLGKLPYLNELRLDSLTGLVQIGFEGGFQQLKILQIWGCQQLEEWSGFGAETAPCWPLLEHLEIRGCPKLKALPPLPLSLQYLVLREVGSSDSPTLCPATPSSSSSSSPSLAHMEIEECKNLTSVAGLLRYRLTSLNTLEISRCEALADLHAGEGFQHLHSIESLTIEYCPKLKMATDAVALTSLSRLRLSGLNHITSFPSEEACRRLTSLQVLRLEDLGGLMSVEGLKALSHLEGLRIEKCPKLMQAAAAAASIKGKEEEEEEFTLSVGDLWIDDPLLLHVEPLRKLTSVKNLYIWDCGNLESEGDIDPWLWRNRTSLRSIHLEKYSTAKSLPRSLQALSSLEGLKIHGAYQLQSLPRMPSSLEWLRIDGCNETLVERCAEDEGADWPNIKHIPEIVVSESNQ